MSQISHAGLMGTRRSLGNITTKEMCKIRIFLGQELSEVKLAGCTTRVPKYFFCLSVTDTELVHQDGCLETIDAKDPIAINILLLQLPRQGITLRASDKTDKLMHGCRVQSLN